MAADLTKIRFMRCIKLNRLHGFNRVFFVVERDDSDTN